MSGNSQKSMRTPLGRVRNHGSGHSGTTDHWRQRTSAVGPAEPALDDHLAEIKGYRRNRHSLDEETNERILREWRRYFEEFGYE